MKRSLIKAMVAIALMTGGGAEQLVWGQTLQWGTQFPSVAPLTGATDLPTSVAATTTNVYVAGSVQLTHGKHLAVAQYDVPAQSGQSARLRSTLYYTNSAAAQAEPIVVDGMAICNFVGTINNAEVQGTRVYVISHSPNLQGKQRVLITAFITQDQAVANPLDYGKLQLTWSVYLDGLPKSVGDEIPVAITVNDTSPQAWTAPAVAVAIKSTRNTNDLNMRTVVLRGTDGKFLFDAESSSLQHPHEIPVGVALRGLFTEGDPGQPPDANFVGHVYLGGTSWTAPGALGPRIEAIGWDIPSGNLLGPPVYVNVENCTATCMSAYRRATDPQGMQYDEIFAIAGFAVPPATFVAAKDIITAGFRYNSTTGQLEQSIEAQWDQASVANPISEDSAVAIAVGASQATDEVPYGPLVVVTGTTKVQGQPQQIATISYYAGSSPGQPILHPTLRWYSLFESDFGFDASPSSIMLDGDAAASYKAYISGAALVTSSNSNFISLKYAADCNNPAPCGPQYPARTVDFLNGPQLWPTTGWSDFGNDGAVSISAQDIVYPGVTGRWFFTVGPSNRGLTGVDWEVLGYQE